MKRFSIFIFSLFCLNLTANSQERDFSFYVDTSLLNNELYVKYINKTQDKIDATIAEIEDKGLFVEAYGMGPSREEAMEDAMTQLAYKIRVRVKTSTSTSNDNGKKKYKSSTDVISDVDIPEYALNIESLPGERRGHKKYQYYVSINLSEYFAKIEHETLRLECKMYEYLRENGFYSDGVLKPEYSQRFQEIKIGTWMKMRDLYDNSLSTSLDKDYAAKKIEEYEYAIKTWCKNYYILYKKECPAKYIKNMTLLTYSGPSSSLTI